MDQLRQQEEVILGLLLVDLLHFLLDVGQLLEGRGQLGVVLRAAEEPETLAELVSLARQTFPGDREGSGGGQDRHISNLNSTMASVARSSFLSWISRFSMMLVLSSNQESVSSILVAY